jgi:hypothetical protein
MGHNRPPADGAILLRSILQGAGAFAPAGSDNDDTTGKLFFCVHLLYGFLQIERRPGSMPDIGTAFALRSYCQNTGLVPFHRAVLQIVMVIYRDGVGFTSCPGNFVVQR